MWIWDLVGPVVLEEVPAVLSIDTEHRHQVGGVHAVSEELESKSWCEILERSQVWFGCGVTYDSVVSTLEDSCEWVIALRNKLDVSNYTD